MDAALQAKLKMKRKHDREIAELNQLVTEMNRLKNPDTKLIKAAQDEIAERTRIYEAALQEAAKQAPGR